MYNWRIYRFPQKSIYIHSIVELTSVKNLLWSSFWIQGASSELEIFPLSQSP